MARPKITTTLGVILVWFCGVVAQENYSVERFIQDIHQEERFDHILVLKNSIKPDVGEYFVRDLVGAVEVPVFIFTESAEIALKKKFNSRVLTVVFLEQELRTKILQQMVLNLRHIKSPMVVVVSNHPSEDVVQLKDLFTFCWRNKVINVLAVFGDFFTTKTFYRYTHMPVFNIEHAEAFQGDVYFPDRTRNLKGHLIRVAYGGSEPKLIFSKKCNGELHIAGYAAHFFEALAQRHNATIVHPKTMPNLVSAQALVYLVRNGSADISAALTYPNVFSKTTSPMIGFTYPYELINWCVMLPIEPNIPGYEIFLMVFRWQTLLTTILFIVLLSSVLEYSKGRSGRKTNLLAFFVNDNCLRGALGQSFSEIRNAPLVIKYIYLQICFLGIILTTYYNSYLQTYVTSPPSLSKIRSFNDLLASGMKIYSWTPEFQNLNADNIFNPKMFVLESSFTKYLQFRDSFNTKYAYMVNNVKWIIVREQQKIFTRPVFRQPDGMCFYDMIPMVFPIDENSIYMDIVNYLILLTHSSGLLEFWQRQSFNEMIDAGKLKLVDLTSKPVFVPMKTGDLKLIWMGMGGAFFLIILCFVVEIMFFKWNRGQKLLSNVWERQN